MANIVWSFGVALTAEDNASKPIGDVTTKIDELSQSLIDFNTAQKDATTNMSVMRNSILDLMDAFNGIDNVRSNVGSDTSDMVDNFGRVGQAATDAGEPVSLLGALIGGALTVGVLAAETVITSFISVGKSLAVNAVKAIWYIIKSTPAALVYAVKTSFSIIKFAADVVLGGIPRLLGLATNAVKKLVDSLMDIPDIIARWTIGKSIETLIRDLDDAHNATQTFMSLGDGFYEFSGNVDRLTASMGGVARQSNELKQNLIQVGKASGATKEQTLALASALSNYGQSLKEIREGGIGTAELQSLSELVTKYKLTTEAAVKLKAETKSLGISTAEIISISQEAASKYGLADALNITAEAAGVATDMYRNFGKQIAGDSKEIVRNITQTAARMSKALNIDVSQAFSKAIDFSKKFAAAQLQNKRAMLGLGDFDELTYTLAQTGMGITQITDLIAKSKDSPIEFAQSVNKMADTMSKRFGDPRVGERFKEQIIQQMSGTGVDLLLRDNNALKKAVDEQATAVAKANSVTGQGLTAFNELYSNSADFLRKTFENTKESFYSLVGLLFSDEIMKQPLKELNEMFLGFSKTFDTFVTDLKSSDGFKGIASDIGKAVKALVGLGTGAKLASQGLTAVTVVTGLLKPLSVGLDIIASTLGLIATSGGLIKLASKALVAISAVGGLKKAFFEIKDIIEDPDKTGFTAFVESGKVAFNAIYNYGKGVITSIGEVLFPDGFKVGVNKAITVVKTEAPKIFESIKSETTEILKSFGINTDLLGLKINSMVSGIKIAFFSLKSNILEIFADVSPIISGILNAIGKIVEYSKAEELNNVKKQRNSLKDDYLAKVNSPSYQWVDDSDKASDLAEYTSKINEMNSRMEKLSSNGFYDAANSLNKYADRARGNGYTTNNDMINEMSKKSKIDTQIYSAESVGKFAGNTLNNVPDKAVQGAQSIQQVAPINNVNKIVINAASDMGSMLWQVMQ